MFASYNFAMITPRFHGQTWRDANDEPGGQTSRPDRVWEEDGEVSEIGVDLLVRGWGREGLRVR
jgi:hypothetical protein